MGAGSVIWVSLEWRTSGTMKLNAKQKSTNGTLAYVLRVKVLQDIVQFQVDCDVC